MEPVRKQAQTVRIGTFSILIFFCIVMIAASGAWAQVPTATITGTVTDQQGAMVPSADIEVKNVDTSIVTTGVSSSTGFYTIPSLIPGQYVITASAANFKKEVRNGIVLQVGDKVELDFKLQIGAASETVEVTGEAPLLETATASLGTVVSQEQITTLPVLNDNVFTLMKLTVGFVNSGASTPSSSTAWSGSSLSNNVVNGSDGFEADYSLSGSPDASREGKGDSNANTIAAVPPADSVGEFKVQTFTYDAENGRSVGGTVNVTLRSGTNKFHGSVYNYLRNTLFNANSWANLQATPIKPRSPMHWNQPGGMISGPAMKNKLFFMFSSETDIMHVPNPVSLEVPTALERTGDFSKTLGKNGSPIAIYDSACSRTTPITGSNLANDTCSAHPMNSIAKALLAAMPLPNITGALRGANNLTISPNVQYSLYHTYVGRVDYTVNAKNTFTMTYAHDNFTQTGGNQGYSPAASAPASKVNRYNDAVSMSLATTLSPNLLATTRVGFSRHNVATMPYGWGFDPSSLGFSGLPALNYPAISLAWPGMSSNELGGSAISKTTNNVYSVGETISKVLRSHSLKFGGEFRIMLDNYNSSGSSSGSFSFDDTFSRASYTSSDGNSGDPTADLLMGYPTSGSVPIGIATAYGDHYYALFFQDDWRVNSKLTLNLGLRWDYESPETERHDRAIVGFNTSSPYQVGTWSGLGGLTYATPGNRMLYNPDLGNIQPRFGIAYKIMDKLVFRGGWGVEAAATSDFPNTYGFSSTTSYIPSLDGNQTPYEATAGVAGLSNPYPNGLSQPTGNSLGLLSYLGNSVSFYNNAYQIQLTRQFSAGLQYELPFKMMLNVSYVGSRQSHHDVNYNMNQLPWDQYAYEGTHDVNGNYIGELPVAGLVSQLSTMVTNPFYGSPYIPKSSSLAAAKITTQQSQLPFPQFTGVTINNLNLAKHWYDALQVQFEKRTSKGFMAMANWTYAQQFSQDQYLNGGHDPMNSTLGKEVGGQHFIMNTAASYLLPFFSHAQGLTNKVLAGWNAAVTQSWQSGGPVGFVSNMNWTGAPLKLSDPGIGPGKIWFNTCYRDIPVEKGGDGLTHGCTDNNGKTLPVAWQALGAYDRLTGPVFMTGVRSPGSGFKGGFNSAFYKDITVLESYKIQFRAEMFNLLNTAIFGGSGGQGPNTNWSSASFGMISKTQQVNQPRITQFSLKISF